MNYSDLESMHIVTSTLPLCQDLQSLIVSITSATRGLVEPAPIRKQARLVC
jgi:hypothetical protein